MGLAGTAEKFAALVAPGSSVSSRVALHAVRHYASAAAASGVALPCRARLAVAVAAQGVNKACEVPEDAERAMAAVLNLKSRSEEEAKGVLDKLAGGLDKPVGQTLRDYVSKRIPSILQYSGQTDFAWDF